MTSAAIGIVKIGRHPVAERQPARRIELEQLEPGPPEREQRGDVRADADERAVAERDLAAVPGEDVQPEQRNHVNRHERELQQPELAHEPREQSDDNGPDHEERRADGSTEIAAHTLRTTLCPKRPCGLISSTINSTTSAAGSRSSPPMKST